MSGSRSFCLVFLFSALFFSFSSYPAPEWSKSDLTGAWQHTATVNGSEVTQVLMMTEGYFSWSEYKAADGDFIMTKGGSWERSGKELILTYEFHTAQPDLVGAQDRLSFKLAKKGLALNAGGAGETDWTRIDEGVVTPLTGAWLFSGRKQNGEGEIQRRSTDQPRKTMKMLTGNRFQWIAYNTETKEFFGTGGGTYTAVNGKYVESILFFSRDKNRVGAELSFDFDVKDGEWHHSGFSSKGDPMYEVWAKRDK